MSQLAIVRLLVRKILEEPASHRWSIQGLGMLRLYLSPNVRLHVWNPQAPHKVAEVSEPHNHPWHFTSFVVAGVITNWLYLPDAAGDLYHAGVIECGPNPSQYGAQGKHDVRLRQESSVYTPGASYSMRAETIHRSDPTPGTVTICTREPLPDPDHATVCWPHGTEWVSAEPRLATPDEVRDITRLALQRMDDEDRGDFYASLDDGGSVGAGHPRHYQRKDPS